MSTEQEGKYRHLVEKYIGLFDDPASTPEDLKSFLHAEILWREMPNRFAPAGTELSGQVASFLQFRDGKIISQTDYPCYDPLPGGTP